MYSPWFRSPSNEGREEGLKVVGALGFWGRVAMLHCISSLLLCQSSYKLYRARPILLDLSVIFR